MSGVTYPLIAEGQFNNAQNALVGLRPDVEGMSTTPEENYFPRCETLWHKMFRQVTYTVSVVGTTGTAPSAWSLGARFEQLVNHTSQYRDMYPAWAPLSALQLEACIAEGTGWGDTPIPSAFGIIANHTTVPDFETSGALPNELALSIAGTSDPVIATARVTRSLTVVNQLGGMRVRLQPSIAGGDETTQILLSVIATGVR